MYSPLIFISLLFGLPLNIYGSYEPIGYKIRYLGEHAPAIYPYQISVQELTPEGWKHHCSGSIITDRHIVTSAQCLQRFKTGSLSIWAGSTNLNGIGKRYSIETYVIHPDYVLEEKQYTSDIGIITISGTFKFSERIRPIAYSADEVNGSVFSVATSWARPRHFSTPTDLRRVQKITITNDRCNASWFGLIDNTHICTEPKYGNGCVGDSGSPLAKDNQLIGIATFGYEICELGKPDVFTRVSTFYEWIKENTHFNEIGSGEIDVDETSTSSSDDEEVTSVTLESVTAIL